MKKLSSSVYFLLTFSFFAGIDFYFSNFIVNKLAQGSTQGSIYSMPFVNLVYVKNTGAAFSILQNSTGFLIILSVFALLAILYYIIRNLETITMKEVFFLSFLSSGIFGNMYERLFFGYVRDFFDIRFINFPIFNISDVFINIGVLGIIVLILLTKKPIRFL